MGLYLIRFFTRKDNVIPTFVKLLTLRDVYILESHIVNKTISFRS